MAEQGRRGWTPGPWKTDRLNHVYRFGKGKEGANIASASRLRAGTTVGYTEPEFGDADLQEICANARLIAGAPCLYEALAEAQAALAMLTAMDDVRDILTEHAWAAAVAAEAKARAALAKVQP